MLTPKQARFVEEYLVDGNGAAAARRAGYSPKRADQLALQTLRNAEVQTALDERRAQLSAQIGRTIADAMADIRRRGQLAEDAGEFTAAIRAAELEAKHLGAFEDRVTHNLGTVGPDWRALLRPAQGLEA